MPAVTSQDALAILPELIVAVGACLLLLIDLVTPQRQRALLAYGSFVVVALAAASTLSMLFGQREAFSGLFVLDPFSSYFKLLLYAATGLTILLSIRYLEIERIHLGEYYAFLLFTTCGLMVMVSSGDLIMIFLGLELAAVSLYILAGINRRESRPIEASAKYFVLGSLSSAIFLYGMSTSAARLRRCTDRWRPTPCCWWRWSSCWPGSPSKPPWHPFTCGRQMSMKAPRRRSQPICLSR